MRMEYVIVGLVLALVILVFLLSIMTGVVPAVETVFGDLFGK